jgi:uncharacterized protein YjbI with pentapeptide repeats
MPSLFQRLFQTEEAAPALNVPTDGLESAIIDAMRGNLGEGLIPAQDLPSAAKELAELFAPEPTGSEELSAAAAEAEGGVLVAEPSEAEGPGDHAAVDHVAIDHVAIDHVAIDHGAIDHGAIGRAAEADEFAADSEIGILETPVAPDAGALAGATDDGTHEIVFEDLPADTGVLPAYLCAFDEDFGLAAPSAHHADQVDDEGRATNTSVESGERAHAEAEKYNAPKLLAQISELHSVTAADLESVARDCAEARAIAEILETEAALAKLEAEALAASAQTLEMLTGAALAVAEEKSAGAVVADSENDAAADAEHVLVVQNQEVVQDQDDVAPLENDAVVEDRVAVENNAANDVLLENDVVPENDSAIAEDSAIFDQEASDREVLAAAVAELEHESSAEASPAAAAELANLPVAEESPARVFPAEGADGWFAEVSAGDAATASGFALATSIGDATAEAGLIADSELTQMVAEINCEDFPDDPASEPGEPFNGSVADSSGKALGERLADAFVHSDARPGDSGALSPDRSDSGSTVVSPTAAPHENNQPVDTSLFEGGTDEALVASARMVALDALAIEGADLVESVESGETGESGEQSPARGSIRSRDWAFEEKLAAHLEWIESRGLTGKKAEFADPALESMELIGVNFRLADLHDANLKEADLLLADLRDACLVRTNLEEACLVGANLEGANLEGANLRSAMGLVPRQLAGANLRDASVPAQIAEFTAKANFGRASGAVYAGFLTIVAIVATSWLMLWRTKDIQLLTDSAIVPFLHSRAAAAALPTAQIYLLVPLVLFACYLLFNFHAQRLCAATLELPAIFPDGQALGEQEPAFVLGLLRAHFRWISQDASSSLTLEKIGSMLLAYWLVPATLFLFWARYLTLEDIHGTVLLALLVVVSTGIALYSTFKVGRPSERWALERNWTDGVAEKFRRVDIVRAALWTGAVLLLLSAGTFMGAPHDRGRAPQYGPANIRRWAPDVLWVLGFDPYADLTEAQISTRPSGWSGADDQVNAVAGPRLSGVRFRYAQAYDAFFANAHLWRANFQGAFLSDADLRGADLGQASLRYAISDGARFRGANLNRATLDGAELARADFRDANLSYASLANATLIDAQMSGANLYKANLMLANLTRANLERADLRNSYLNAANLEHADFRQAYLWSSVLAGADMQEAQLGNAILIGTDLRGVNFRGAQFAGTVLSDANMSGAILDGADFRGASGVNANQICEANSRWGARLDASLAVQVMKQCGGLGESATIAPSSATSGAANVAAPSPASAPTSAAPALPNNAPAKPVARTNASANPEQNASPAKPGGPSPKPAAPSTKPTTPAPSAASHSGAATHAKPAAAQVKAAADSTP